jgi:mono/diheme cytochrome c family protein
MKLLKIGLVIAAVVVALAAAIVYSGVFDVAADVPHSAIVYALMEAVRDRSIAVRVKDIQAPPLDDPKLVISGAEDYAAMCVDCHLAPAVKESEIRAGLYPQPPNLTQHIDAGPGEMFWVIKHGIKMSAMPAWGKTHDDHRIWGMVAFLQKLPEITPDQYLALVKPSGEAHHHDHQHRHDQDGTEHGAEDIGHSHNHGDAAAHKP